MDRSWLGRKIKSVSASRQGTAADEVGVLSGLTREELGGLWASELRVARESGALKTAGRCGSWLNRPTVRVILAEIKRRHYELEAERDLWLAIFQDWGLAQDLY